MSGAGPTTGEALRLVPFFAGLADEDLARIAARTTEVAFRPGQTIAVEGEHGDALYVVLEGELDVVKHSDRAEVPIARVGPGEIVGEMSVLEDVPRMASLRAASEIRLLRVGRDAVLELLATRPTATLAMVRIVMERLRSSEAALREREKLAGLGTLAAGVAHELNNPAAAIRRSADLLHGALDDLAAATRQLGAALPDPASIHAAAALADELARRTPDLDLGPLEASDRSGEFAEHLAARGVAEPDELAASLVSYGWTRDDLDRVEGAFPGDAFPAVVCWIGATASAHALAEEIEMASGRISEIVRAVKEYTFMDQAPVGRIDLRRGLENTLVILRAKLKHGIEVDKDLPADLPEIEAYGSELNQVWTNLIDNAVDAMGGQGRIRIAARVEGSSVIVEICDNGPGIPPEIRNRIFEPFFTTKPPGVGTGLGLHISHSIVRRHGGRIDVRSVPGDTCFTITLPQELAR